MNILCIQWNFISRYYIMLIIRYLVKIVKSVKYITHQMQTSRLKPSKRFLKGLMIGYQHFGINYKLCAKEAHLFTLSLQQRCNVSFILLIDKFQFSSRPVAREIRSDSSPGNALRFFRFSRRNAATRKGSDVNQTRIAVKRDFRSDTQS